jgi:hypothetical protein
VSEIPSGTTAGICVRIVFIATPVRKIDQESKQDSEEGANLAGFAARAEEQAGSEARP